MKVVTESGTVYQFDGRKVTRILGDGSHELRHDGSPLSYTFWGNPEVGKRMTMVFDANEYNADGKDEFVMPMRTTTPVVSIQYDAD